MKTSNFYTAAEYRSNRKRFNKKHKKKWQCEFTFLSGVLLFFLFPSLIYFLLEPSLFNFIVSFVSLVIILLSMLKRRNEYYVPKIKQRQIKNHISDNINNCADIIVTASDSLKGQAFDEFINSLNTLTLAEKEYCYNMVVESVLSSILNTNTFTDAQNDLLSEFISRTHSQILKESPSVEHLYKIRVLSALSAGKVLGYPNVEEIELPKMNKDEQLIWAFCGMSLYDMKEKLKYTTRTDVGLPLPIFGTGAWMVSTRTRKIPYIDTKLKLISIGDLFVSNKYVRFTGKKGFTLPVSLIDDVDVRYNTVVFSDKNGRLYILDGISARYLYHIICKVRNLESVLK